MILIDPLAVPTEISSSSQEINPGPSFLIPGFISSNFTRAPFRWLPGISQKVKKYEEAKEVILNKHHL